MSIAARSQGHSAGASGGPCRARSAVRTAPAPSGAATARAPRRPPATWPPCRETGSRRRAMAQARQPSSAACSSVNSPCEKRAPIDCTLPASSPSLGGSVTPPGTSTHGKSCMPPGPSSSPAAPCRRSPRPARRRRVGSERISRRKTRRRIVAIGQAVHHADRALRAAIAGIGAKPANGTPPAAATPRPPPS